MPAPIGERIRDRTARTWDIILWVDLGLLGLLLLAALWISIRTLVSGEPAEAAAPAEPGILYASMWIQSLLFIALMAVVPLLWAANTHVGGWRGAVAYFRLERPGRGILLGTAVWLGCYVALIALGAILTAFGYEPENPQADLILETVDWPLAIAIALSAGVGEEILFRGILQRRIGFWGQAILFGLAHASYGTPLQLAVPFLLGVAFGLMVRRGWSLWVPITAHVLFDFVQLALHLSGAADRLAEWAERTSDQAAAITLAIAARVVA